MHIDDDLGNAHVHIDDDLAYNVITGAKNMQDVYNGWKNMLELLNKYKIKKVES